MKRLIKKFVISFIIIFTSSTIEAQSMMENAQEISLRPKIEYKSEGSRDPFQPSRKEEKVIKQEAQLPPQPVSQVPLPALTISATVWGGVFPQAIINDKIVKPGDSIEGVDIVDISKDGITVSFANRIYNLPSSIGENLQDFRK
jgi:hypothetical protein